MEPAEVAQSECDLDVVMVVHDRKRLAFEGIERLRECASIRGIVAVDNASSDGLKHEGPVRFPAVAWLRLEDNRGCAAWNLGMEHTTSPFALILDDDCVPDPDSLEAARQRMAADPSIGLAVFNIVNHASGESEWGPFENVDGSAAWANAIGACMLVRVEAFREVGGYKDFFLCFNDLELVLSLWKSGWRVVYERNWKAHHKRNPGTRLRRFELEVRNFATTSLGHLPVAPAGAVIALFVLRAFRDAQGQRAAVLRAARDGVREGLRLRGTQPGELPALVKRLFYANFLLGARFVPRGLRRD